MRVDERVRSLRVLDIDLGDHDFGPELCHGRVLCGFWPFDAQGYDCSFVSNSKGQPVLVEATADHGSADLHFAKEAMNPAHVGIQPYIYISALAFPHICIMQLLWVVVIFGVVGVNRAITRR